VKSLAFRVTREEVSGRHNPQFRNNIRSFETKVRPAFLKGADYSAASAKNTRRTDDRRVVAAPQISNPDAPTECRCNRPYPCNDKYTAFENPIRITTPNSP
jgi:hypothetical protein